jgi:deoxyadenosine/deoxycytidine kinase
MGARRQRRHNVSAREMINPLNYLGQHVLFLPWRVHLAICLVLLFWRKDHTAAVSWLGAMIALRLVLLYFYVCYSFVRWIAGAVLRAWRGAYHFLFHFLPFAPSREATLRERHAAVKKVIMIEGLICAGKTTIVSRLRRCPNIVVYDEAVPQDVLRRFNESGDGTEIQEVMGRRRRKNAAESIELVRQGERAVVHDRSLVGCRAFALWNFVAGSLTYEALARYLDLANGKVADDFARIGRAEVVVLYLPVPVRVALGRLRQRAGPDQATPEKYMLGVSLMHALVLVSLLKTSDSVSVLFYTSDDADGPVADGECVCRHLRRATKTHNDYANVEALMKFDGRLELSELERARLDYAATKLLELSPIPHNLIYEIDWTRWLFGHVRYVSAPDKGDIHAFA